MALQILPWHKDRPQPNLIYCPYTKLGNATKIALLQYGDRAKFIDLSLQYLEPLYWYADYMHDRWQERQTFINIEHDVVPWPGAIDEITKSAFDWCCYSYSPTDQVFSLGCSYFSAIFFSSLSGIFPADIDWMSLDNYITSSALSRNIYFHQHFPSVLNANESQLT